VQLVLENRDDDFLADHASFYREIGLPLTLEGLGQKDPSARVLHLIAEKTLAAPHMANFPAAVSHQQMTSAMRRVEDLFR
jgi:glycerol dehydrogenase